LFQNLKKRNGLISARKNGIPREAREIGGAQIDMKKAGFKIEYLHDRLHSSLRKTIPREIKRYMYHDPRINRCKAVAQTYS
jgi:hypothetical protein